MRLVGQLLRASTPPLIWALSALACKTTSLGNGVEGKAPLASGSADVPEALPAPRTSPAEGEVRFVALGDAGKGNQGQRDVGRALAAHCKRFGCDFVLLLGDNVYESGVSSANDPLFHTLFEEPYAEVAAPFYVVLGNHDYGTSGAGMDLWRGAYEVEYTARSKKWRMPSEYYHFERALGRGGALEAGFFALDTQMILLGRAARQRKEIAEWLDKSTAKWKVAFGHHPYLSNGPHGNAGHYNGVPFFGNPVKHFLEDEVCGKVDFYFAGHDHSLQLLEGGCKTTKLFVSGTGASPTSITNKNPTFYQSAELGFLYGVLREDELNVSVIDVAGSIQYARVYRK
ncbi:MAG: metallophosphoesterase [Polyangiaceae bacterium]